MDDSNLKHRFCFLIAQSDYQDAQRYINNGFKVKNRHSLGFHPLHIATSNDDLKMVKILVENGADVNVTDIRNQNFPIDYISNIRRIFFKNINANANTDGFTPLHYAVVQENAQMVKFLIQNGADPSICCKGGEKPEDLLYNKTSQQSQTILKLLKEDAIIYQQEKSRREREFRDKNPLEDIFRAVIVGQDAPIHEVASAIRRKQNGWCDDERPLVFLFLGSSGVGKTELAKQLAKHLHPDNPDGFIRLDLSEFQSRHEVSKFIGSPPGYIGYDEGGQLTEKLNENPDAVVLLDEVEKAHIDVLNVMLQLFDEGRITNGKGQTVNCPKAIFVMTSNLAQREIADNIEILRKQAENYTRQSFIEINSKNEEKSSKPHESGEKEIWEQNSEISREFLDQTIMPILREHFKRDEFLGRINEIVLFLPFSEAELRTLVTTHLEKWAEKAKKKHCIELTWTDEVTRALSNGYNKYYGARSIHHEVDRKIINRLAKAHESGLLTKGSQVTVFEKDGRIGVKVNEE